MILKKCVTLQFCAKLLCTELVETYKKIKKLNCNPRFHTRYLG